MAEEGRILPSFFIDSILQKDVGCNRLVAAPASILPRHVDAGGAVPDHDSRPGADPILLPGIPAPGAGVLRHPDPGSSPDPYTLIPTMTRRRDTPPTPPEELDDTPEAMNYHRDAGAVCVGGVEGGYHGDEACYHDAMCGHGDYNVRGSIPVAGHGGGGGGGYGGEAGCGVEGSDRRGEDVAPHMDVTRSTHSPDEPKPEVSDLGLGDDGKKRPRTAFSADQVRSLEQEFQRSKYLSVSKRTEMSRQLGLTEQQIKIWFQNRRTKWKRKYTNNLEILAQQHYLRMGLLPAYPFHAPGGANKPTSGPFGGMFGAGVGGVRPPFPTHVHPQPTVRLYPPFTPGHTLPRM